ncbi:MAG: N-formylglutamate deformylase [Cytophagales bacterium]|nr:N-formylglutamate deformylase [Cytophagales bacterium]
MIPFTLHTGTLPLLVSVPHAGTQIPDDLHHTLSDKALQTPDTDWFLDKLYAFSKDLGASMIEPHYSRYVIDLNRPPDNQPMYAGNNNTELCPTRAFTGESIYKVAPPDLAEIERRKALYWQPYHTALQAELARIKAQHGYALLWDGHSIKSTVPWLFEGRLPDLNMGTNNGASCAASLQAMLEATLQAPPHTQLSHIFNGRFKGGYITRTYGNPAQNIHAVQLEMCWSTYMQEHDPDPEHFELDAARAAQLAPTLQALLQTMLNWKPAP